MTLAELAAAIRRCHRCRLARGRRQAVPGEGDPRARIMLVGEAPGAEEDRTGRPFVGPAGRFLDRLFAAVGIDRQTVFLTSCVKCRPPANRDPRRDELQVCTTSWLLPQIELLKPDLIVLCGRVAARQLLGEPVKIAALHGKLRQRHGQRYFVTYHPAAAMRFPEKAAAMRLDFQRLAGLVAARLSPEQR